MLKTREEIEEMVAMVAAAHFDKAKLPIKLGNFTYMSLLNISAKVAEKIQQDIKEACSGRFNECFSKYATESNLHHEFDAHYFWQAAKLDSMKELQEKDNKIKDLEEKFKAERNDVLYMDKRVLEEKDKYQESVNDIEFLLNISRPLACMDRDKVDDLWSKYVLNNNKEK